MPYVNRRAKEAAGGARGRGACSTPRATARRSTRASTATCCGRWRARASTKVIEFPDARASTPTRPRAARSARRRRRRPTPRPPRGGIVALAREFDLVVLCAGYRRVFPFLDAQRGPEKGCGGRRRPPEGGRRRGGPRRRGPGPRPRRRRLAAATARCRPSTSCATPRAAPRPIGFVRPNVSLIPPMAELQAMWWLERVRGRCAGPARGAWGRRCYGLLGAKHQYSVDYGMYMHELARDIGALPRPLALLRRSPRVWWTYAMGQAFVSHFRLFGPFAHARAWDTAAHELCPTTLRRGFQANAVFVAMNVFLAGVNVAFALVDLALWRRRARRRARPARAGLGARSGCGWVRGEGARGWVCRACGGGEPKHGRT